jgi:glycosyltransferase involved in cell wall biosynthesis
MHLVALVEDEEHVCCRYRLKAFQQLWGTVGFRLTFQPLPKGWWGRWFWNEQLRQADAVIIQRKLLPVWAVHRLRRYVRYLIYDFDDALWLRDSYARHGLEDERRRRRFAALVRLCDLVVAGNSFLAAAVRHVAPATPVAVIPTSVDPTLYPLAQHTADSTSGIRLVWIGSRSTLQGLWCFRETLEQIGRSVAGVRLKLICDHSLTFRDLPVDFVPWHAATEAAELAAADIGISWLPVDDWSRGKCGLKVLQYQAAGLPVVVNPVGVQADMVCSGQTGYLAQSCPEWVEAIRRLGMDPELRRRMGAAGRRQVEQHYSVAVASQQWLEALTRWIKPRRQAS